MKKNTFVIPRIIKQSLLTQKGFKALNIKIKKFEWKYEKMVE